MNKFFRVKKLRVFDIRFIQHSLCIFVLCGCDTFDNTDYLHRLPRIAAAKSGKGFKLICAGLAVWIPDIEYCNICILKNAVLVGMPACTFGDCREVFD